MLNQIRVVLTSISFFILQACGGGGEQSLPSAPVTATLEKAPTLEMMEEIRTFHQTPAVAGGVWKNGQLVESGAVGLRASGQPDEVSGDDKWHIGSITKSITATLAARLVEQGLLNWDSTIYSVLQGQDMMIPSRYHDVTLRQLLSHRGGMVEDMLKLPNWHQYFHANDDIQRQRLRMTAEIFSVSHHSPGTFRYSNAGYVVVASMLEVLTGQPWEALIEQEVFIPLAMHDAGFGAPDDGFTLSQPYGHKWQNGKWQAVAPQEDFSDNPAALGPAGTLHMTLQDLSRYAQAHIAGRNGDTSFLSAASFTMLHQSVDGGNYAMGWFVDGEARFHDGSNTMWYAKLGWNAQQQVVAIAFTNAGGDSGNAVTDDIINTLMSRL